MTALIASPAPAARLPRAVLRRRALQLALLLGGLIGLGYLCGGQAHADDASGAAVGAPAPRHVAVRESVHEAASAPERKVRTAPGRVSGDVRARVAEPVREKVVKPAVDTVREVTEPVTEPVTESVGELTGQVVGGLVEKTPRPLPDVPPALPALPELPGMPGHSAPRPVPAEPAEPAATQPVHAPAAERGKHSAPRAHGAATAGPTAYDSAWPGDVQRNGVRHASAARHTAAAQPAAPHAPPRPDGALVAGAAAGDGSSTRHGDLHAAAFGSRVPVLLPPGALASGGPAPVADRHRDIPEFPG
ncbi:hypothetical protein ACIREE_00245 [Streptomyces sp. NPDC102467]|uniref:hypothetical protein n=1 Tax=Streptomyces sp. NPDC102467 TaxID=3366179 RepID=UPI00381D6F6E